MVWNHAVFSKNRERLLNEEIAEGFFQRVLECAKPHMSDEHFTVDGTLIEAWASQKSFRRKDGKGNPPGAGGEVGFHGEPQRAFGADFSDRSQRKSGAGCCDADGRDHSRWYARDNWWRQELRHAGIGPRTTWDEHHPECGAERYEPQKRGGSTDHTARRIRGESAEAKRVEPSFGWMKMVGMLKKVKLRGITKLGGCLPSPGLLTTSADCETCWPQHDTECRLRPVQQLERPKINSPSSPQKIKFEPRNTRTPILQQAARKYSS